MRLSWLGEFDFINEISGEFAYSLSDIVKGIGDDAGVTAIDEKRCLLTTTDVLVEDVHFSLNFTPAFVLGRKCVSVSLSDIAAMGGTPKYLLLSLSIPEREGMELEFFKNFYKGVKEVSEVYGVSLIGGNTSSSPCSLIINSTMIGDVLRDEVVYRTGARVGDRIFVTGTLGDSALGLKMWKTKDSAPVTDPFLKDAMLLHIDPVARVKEGRMIAETGLATAMIDISDGLAADIGHIMESSKVGARIYIPQCPLSTALKRYLQEDSENTEIFLSGGEDYELLFTVNPSKVQDVKRIADKSGSLFTEIGEITDYKEGVVFVDENGKSVNVETKGFDHFESAGKG